MLDGFKDSFREEAYELLNALEQSLLELEDRPDDHEVVSAVFRSMHTIKGSASMFGFDAISAFTHHVETTFDEVRNGRLSASQALIDVTLESRDHIRAMLEEPDHPDHEERSRELIARLTALIDQEQGRDRPPVVYDDSVSTEAIGSDEGAGDDDRAETGSHRSDGGEGLAGDDAPRPTVTWHIRFVPSPAIAENGTNPLLLLAELHDLGDCTVAADTRSIPELDSDRLDEAHVTWDVFLTTNRGENDIRDVFIFLDDESSLTIRAIDEIDFSEEEHHRRLGQILIDRGVVDPTVVQDALDRQKRLGEVLVERGVDLHQVETALQEQEHVKKTRRKVESDQAASSVRVPSEKLDVLIDLVGELVTLQARLNQTTGHLGGEVSAIGETFERLVAELRDHTMSIRMVPIAGTFSRFRRLVRDLSRELDKEIELVTEGGETELDKTVIERLNDPLIHVIRNSIDHGIEMPAVRRTAGKPSVGTVTLTARHVGGNVEVRIVDDGAGLNRERIRLRAVERGIIGADAQLSESELLDLVFAPGFSTAATVTSVSGRGVGMDVVRKQVESIGGSVTVESHEGAGTAVVMSIPLTLAIIDGLLVRIGAEHFVVPLSNVEECIEYRRGSENDGVVANRGGLIPILDLRREFDVQGTPPEIEQAVVMQTGIGTVAAVVDAVIGDHQTVIKNLGHVYHNVEGVSGATILGDGSVALILDVQRLVAGKGHELRYA